MSRKFRIRDEGSGKYLAIIRLDNTRKRHKLIWATDKRAAIIFDTDEEARATIDFIIDVIAWEYENWLTIE